MAHFDVHRNRRGYDGYEEPTYGARPLAAIVGYSATVESYVAEKVVPIPVRPDQMWPRSSAHIQTKQIDEYDNSPKLIHANGSPRKAFHGDNSPPAGHYPSKFGPHLSAPHESPHSPKLTHTNGNGSPHDSPRKPFHGANSSPSTGQYPVKYGGPHDSPRNNFRDTRGGFSNDDDSSDDDDVECRDGVCYPKPKHGGGQGYDYDKEKKKGNGYAAGNYPLQHHSTDHQPRKDLHRQASDGHKYYSTEKMPEGNNIYGSHSYNAPAHSKPTTGGYYDRFSYPASDDEHNNTNYTHSKTEPYAVPAPIKTRPDRRDAGKSSPLSAVAHWTPFASSPRNGHEPQHSGGPAADRRYRGTGTAIDCKEAAIKYGGVFVK